MKKIIQVDVIVPVHNAEDTIEETVNSAMNQSIPLHLLLDDEHDDDNNMHTDVSSKKYEHYLDNYKRCSLRNIQIDVAVCCYDDGSTDKSLDILNSLKKRYEDYNDGDGGDGSKKQNDSIVSRLIIGQSSDGSSRGAGYARNRAASLRAQHITTGTETENNSTVINSFICLLDSDDVMHKHRIAEQLSVMLQIKTKDEQNRTLLGCTFTRIPEDSTWHYTNWANNILTDERLILERFREVTILQPTWFLTRCRFELLGGYIEAPAGSGAATKLNVNNDDDDDKNENPSVYKLIHPQYDTEQTLRLAEDLRLFHAHLLYNSHSHPDTKENFDVNCNSNDGNGILRLIRSKEPLLKYRHRIGQSQSSSTSRKLLLQLRAKAFVDTVILSFGKCNSESKCTSTSSWLYCDKTQSGGFVIWGAGRDGKEFFKSLEDDMKQNVRCFVDVDEKKINSGYYIVPMNHNNNIHRNDTNINNSNNGGGDKRKKKKKKMGTATTSCIKVPIVHYSLLVKNDEKRHLLMNEWMYPTSSTLMEEQTGRITKNNPSSCSVQEGISTNTSDSEATTKANKRIKIERNSKQQQNSNENLNSPNSLTTISDNSSNANNHNKKNNGEELIHKQQSPPQRKLHGLSKKDELSRKMLDTLKDLPVIVCVAMYRSNGILENNVKNIGRTEGNDLWHFS